MQEFKGTPGPWHVSNEGCMLIRDDAGLSIVAKYVGYTNDEEELANARLISAAPELLEALQGYMSAVERMNQAMKDGVNVQGAISALVGYEDMAHSAINKALGK